jgi:endonuclease YncB( thermonuclease family)
LVYVKTQNGEKMLNEMLIREGLAKFMPNYRYSKEVKNILLNAESEAKQQKKGIHSIP